MIPSINNTFDNLKIDSDKDITIATLTKYYPEIDQSWDEASQQVATNGALISREYSFLSFPPSEKGKIAKVNLGEFDPDWGADYYYLVTSYFTETTYTSSYNTSVEYPFLEWEKKITEFRQEISYKPALLDTLTLLGIFQEGQVRILNVGNNIVASIFSNMDIEVRQRESQFSQGEVEPETDLSSILLGKPFLEITFLTPGSSVIVNFVGEQVFRTYLPSNLSKEEVSTTLVHPINYPLELRLKPPGLPNVVDNFWNTNYSNLPNYFSKNRYNTPQWI